jgi:hypothetical protein
MFKIIAVVFNYTLLLILKSIVEYGWKMELSVLLRSVVSFLDKQLVVWVWCKLKRGQMFVSFGQSKLPYCLIYIRVINYRYKTAFVMIGNVSNQCCTYMFARSSTLTQSKRPTR